MPRGKVFVKNADILLDNSFPFMNRGSNSIMASTALLYYKRCSPIFTAINLIADEFANMKPYVYDKKAKKFIDDHESLELLSHPFGDTTWTEFAQQMASYFLVTGNNYILLTGPADKPPVEMQNIYPGAVSILPSPRDGYAGSYLVTTPYYSYTLNRKETLKHFRFLDKYETTEIWQIKTFNPQSQAGFSYYGLSKLNPIYYEMEQHMQASVHNLALLMNGARMSAVFSVEGELKEETYKRLKDEIQRCYEGSSNAGKTFLAEAGLKAQEMGMNNVDMDFLQLKKEVTYQMYTTLKVPLQMVSLEKTTLNNMENGILMLYDNCVIPTSNRLFSELTMAVMPRYKNSENLIYTYNEDDITALKDRKVAQTEKKSKMGIYTINESRSSLGEDPVEGGDNIFIPSTNQPISVLAEAGDDDETSDGSEELDPGQAAEEYTEALSRQRLSDGKTIMETILTK